MVEVAHMASKTEKAYMSTGVHDYGPVSPRSYWWNLVDQARAAEHEARRILEDTEQAWPPHRPAVGYYTPAEGYAYMGEVWIDNPVDGNAHAALAEALNAFITEEV